MVQPLPEITHLQFLVLGGVRSGSRPGQELRRLLEDHGILRSGPAFYQMMARLEDAGWIEGHYEQTPIDGRAVTRRRYAITPAGAAEWEATRAFYLDRIAADREPENA